MDEEEQPDREPAPASGRRWLGWALVAAGAAGGLWLAAFPLDQLLPEPRSRVLAPEPPAAGTGTLESPPPGPATAPGATPAPQPALTPVPEAEAIDPPATTPSAEWVEDGPGELAEDEPPAQEALRARIERQLVMNDLGGVRVEIAGDRIVTSGSLARPGDRQRVALLVRSLAPDLVHEDHARGPGSWP
jgi:hypothetical protein